MSDPLSPRASIRLQPRQSPFSHYFFGRDLFPTPPLSWLAPLWYYGCGVIASGYWRTPGAASLSALLGLVLIVPLLGTAWRGALAIHQRRLRIQSAPPGEPRPSHFDLPYTLPSSMGHRFVSLLANAAERWTSVRRLLELPLLELAVGCTGAAIIAAVLGAPTLWLTGAGLAVACVAAFASSAVADHVLVSVALPLLTCWMVGLSLTGQLDLLPMVAGALMALTASASFLVEREGRGLPLQLAPQALLLPCVLLSGQPLAALAVSLCAMAQLLWAPALATAERRARFHQSVQVLWAAAMLAASLALGAVV